MRMTQLYNKKGKHIGVINTWRDENLGTDIFLGKGKTTYKSLAR